MTFLAIAVAALILSGTRYMENEHPRITYYKNIDYCTKTVSIGNLKDTVVSVTKVDCKEVDDKLRNKQ